MRLKTFLRCGRVLHFMSYVVLVMDVLLLLFLVGAIVALALSHM
jgi:hypothetical protein